VAIARGIEQARLDEELGAGRALAAAFDLSSRPAWAELDRRLSSEGLEPSGAVLAAGAWRGGKKLHEEADDAAWTAMLAANLETARVSLQALLPGMVERKRGSIVLVGSRAAERPWESAKAAAYAASKAAVVALAGAVAAEVRQAGVRVNVILPSTIDTPQNRASMPKADVSRWVTPESIADVAKFLLSEAARDISGAVIPVYGQA
jgi:NAD(P)-dependent dehydrogenase (short-subunit alcohol dehydrogenase family)